MSSPAPTPAASDVADAIARAELRRTQLVLIGMELAEEIRERNVQAPLHPEPRHDPARAFALVSRAVRLSLAFAARIDADIMALRNGEFSSRATAGGSEPACAAVVEPPPENEPDPRRVRIRSAVWAAINQEIGDLEGANYALDRVHESLIEREDYENWLDRPWRECVEAICADLGLRPDWSLWSDETGFPKNDDGPHKDWPRLWAYSPTYAEERRRRRAERLKAAEASTAPPAHPPDPHPRR
jgi:hypothetical protein